MEDHTQGQRWPPTLDWNLAIASETNRDAPRRFLEEDAWKLFLVPRAPSLRTSRWKNTIVVGVRWFNTMGACVRQHGESVLRYHLKEGQQQFFGTILSAVSREVDFEFEVEADLDVDHDSVLRQRLGMAVRGRQIREWIDLYLHGRSFALALGAETVSRFVFIEELFGAPLWYERARVSLTALDGKPLILSGMPRAGKTYTALRLLYDVHVQCFGSVCFFDDVYAFSGFVDRLANRKGLGGPKIFCVLDDPFGAEECDETFTLGVRRAMGRLRDALGLQLLITSRSEVLEVARRIAGPVLCEPNVVEFTFDGAGTVGKPDIYPIEQLEGILEKAAWLLGASWLGRYELYRRMKSSSVAPVGAEHEAWHRVLEIDSVPGVIWSALLMNPAIGAFRGESTAEICRIGERMASARDLRVTYNSELLAWLSVPENEADPAKVLYLLLPSITVVYPDLLKMIFNPEEEASLRSVGESFICLKEAFGAYSIESIQYFHPSVAHAVQDVVKQRGRSLYQELLLPYIVRKENVPPRIVADFLCSYFSLGCPANALTGELLDRLYHSQSPIEKQWVSVVAAFFVESSQPGELLSDALGTADLEVLSRVSVLVDELLSADLDADVNEERLHLLLGSFFRSIFSLDLGSRPEDFALRGSLILHGVLSHLEDYLSLSLAEGKDRNLDDVVDLVREMSGAQELMRLLKSDVDVEVVIQAASVWIDALLMKIGEIQYYLTSQLDTEQEGDAEADGESQKRALLQALVLRMMEVVEELWRQSLVKSEADSWRQYLAGAMAFSVAWHNRWGVSGGACDPITDWVGNGGFLTGEVEGEPFWEGVRFNLLYHSRYFQARASAWHRETALRLWRRGKPRLGADSSHEGGLDSSEQDSTWGQRFSTFYHACITRLLPLDATSASATTEEIAGITFVLGLRAPREDGLAEDFVSRIASVAAPHSWPFRDGFWEGMLRLYLHNICDSIRLTEEPLMDGIRQWRRDNPERLAQLAGMANSTAEKLRSTSGELWVAQGLDRLRPVMYALTEL